MREDFKTLNPNFEVTTNRCMEWWGDCIERLILVYQTSQSMRRRRLTRRGSDDFFHVHAQGSYVVSPSSPLAHVATHIVMTFLR